MGRKKLVRKAEPWKPPPEERDRLEQQPKARWRPTKNQVVRATKVPAALLLTGMVISIIWLLWRDVIRVGGNSDYLLRGVLTVVGILILIGVGYRFEWTGFREREGEKSEIGEIQRRKNTVGLDEPSVSLTNDRRHCLLVHLVAEQQSASA